MFFAICKYEYYKSSKNIPLFCQKPIKPPLKIYRLLLEKELDGARKN